MEVILNVLYEGFTVFLVLKLFSFFFIVVYQACDGRYLIFYNVLISFSNIYCDVSKMF